MKNAKMILLVLAMVALGMGIYAWQSYSEQHPSTDDAQINANTLYLSPQISGLVVDVPVHSYQPVKKGDVLLRLDDSSYRLAVQQAQAAVTAAQDQMRSASAKTRASAAEAASAQQQQANAALDNQRNQTLGSQGLIPREQADDTRFKLQEAKAAAAAANATISAVQAAGGQASAQLQTAQLAVAQAQLNLSHSVITAPADGILGEVNTQAGDFVDTGENLFPMVDTNHYWVDANFKETDLARIQPGQTASIQVDMDSKHTYQGMVEAISPASGTAFSLIPAQNATGNWVKVTQRFPVRIRLDTSGTGKQPLRVGASASVTVNTANN